MDAEIIELQGRVRLLAFHEKDMLSDEHASRSDSVIKQDFIKPQNS